MAARRAVLRTSRSSARLAVFARRRRRLRGIRLPMAVSSSTSTARRVAPRVLRVGDFSIMTFLRMPET